MIEGQSHINVEREAGFTIISVILVVIAVIILWKLPFKEIGALIDLLAVPFLVVAMYYGGWFENDNKRVKS